MFSAAPQEPSLVTRLKNDMKEAMKAKDQVCECLLEHNFTIHKRQTALGNCVCLHTIDIMDGLLFAGCLPTV